MKPPSGRRSERWHRSPDRASLLRLHRRSSWLGGISDIGFARSTAPGDLLTTPDSWRQEIAKTQNERIVVCGAIPFDFAYRSAWLLSQGQHLAGGRTVTFHRC